MDYGLNLNTEKCELCELCFPGETKYALQNNLKSILKTMSKKIKSKDELVILGSPIGASCREEIRNGKKSSAGKNFGGF